jgi:peptidoglycan/LPS O-acetylase OafA/YrhL
MVYSTASAPWRQGAARLTVHKVKQTIHLPKQAATISARLELDAGVRVGTRYLYELECIRGLAILLVFLFHAYGISVADTSAAHSLPMSFIVAGNTGVTLFFVLSGFLLSQPWLASIQDPEKPLPSISNYYLARALRIMPLYYFAVLLAIVISGNWHAGAKALLFGFVGFDIFPYSVVWWTLSTEVQFYLLLPLMFAGWIRGRLWRAVTIASLAVWLYWYARHVVLAQDSIAGSFLLTKSIFARLPAFLFGIAACWIYLRCRHQRPSSIEARCMLLLLTAAALMALGFVLQKAAAMGGRAAENSWHIHHTYEAGLWTILLLTLLLGNLPGKVLLINRGLAITGKLSYSLYLNHVPVLFFMIYPYRERLGQAHYEESIWLFAIPAMAYLLSMALSYMTYRFIELPFLNAKHRLKI